MLDLILRIEGSVQKNNLPEFKEEALAMVKAANVPLVTDDDFSNAEKTVKNCKEAEDAISIAKHNALRETADIAALFESLDEVSNELRNTRVSLDKQIKKEKVERKKALVDSFCSDLSVVISDLNLSQKHAIVDRKLFDDAIKGKRTLSKMSEALADVLNEETGRFVRLSEDIEANRTAIENAEDDFPGLFPDKETLVVSGQENIKSTIESRIAKFQLAEIKRKEAEKKEEEIKAKESAEIKEQNDMETVEQEFAPKNEQPKVETTSNDHVVHVNTDDEFTISISLICSIHDAKAITNKINTIVGHEDIVKNIKLSRF